MKSNIITSVVVVFLAGPVLGCIKSANSYIPPKTFQTYINFKEIDKPKDQVWKELINSLGQHFFVINNLDKDSGLINVSYSGDPIKYVDCGKISYDLENARGARHYEFEGAQAVAQYETTNQEKTQIARMTRKMSLEGRMNIIVESISQTRTRITVNTKYILTKTIEGETMIVQGFVSNWVHIAPSHEVITFNSNQNGTYAIGKTICQPTGALESEVLAMIN